MKKIISIVLISILFSCNAPNTENSNFINVKEIKSDVDLYKYFDYYKNKIEQNPNEEIFYNDLSYLYQDKKLYLKEGTLDKPNDIEFYTKSIDLLIEGNKKFPENSKISNTLLDLLINVQEKYSRFQLFLSYNQDQLNTSRKIAKQLLEFYDRNYSNTEKPIFIKESIEQSKHLLSLTYYREFIILADRNIVNYDILFKILENQELNDLLYQYSNYYNSIFLQYSTRTAKDIDEKSSDKNKWANFFNFINQNSSKIKNRNEFIDYINFRIAQEESKLESWKKSIEILDSLIFKNPKNLENYNLLSEIYEGKDENKFIDTINKMIEIIKLDKTNKYQNEKKQGLEIISFSQKNYEINSLLNKLVNYFMRNKNYNQAIIYLEKLDNLSEDMFQNKLQIALTYKFLNNINKMNEYIEKSIKSPFFKDDISYDSQLNNLLAEYYLSKNDTKKYFYYLKKG